MKEADEFYIGYQPRAPRNLARLIRWVVAALFALGALAALVLVFGQRPFPAAFFDFGNVRDFEGTLRLKPVPMLQEQGGRTRHALTAEGKHGLAHDLAQLDGRRVRLRGTAIRRDGMSMLEVADGSLQPLDAAPVATPDAGPVELGVHTLIGEIVDSKCYLGVMNPGRAKPHRDCAVRCISGGVPPLFVVQDAMGGAAQLWLVNADGSPVNQQVLDRVAEPLAITGAVARIGAHLVLRADPAGYRRVY
jgi:hypothetical protein